MGEGQNMFNIVVTGGGAIGYILWALSIVMVALVVRSAMQIRRSTILPEMSRLAIQELFNEKQYKEAIDVTEADPSFIGYVLHAALTEAGHGYGAMERAMEEANEEKTTCMLRDIEWLNLIGNIGPMLGLMGTVWGMILTFFKLASSDSMPKPGVLAESIGVALVTTLIGLMVAIPALSAYAILRNRVDALTSEAMVASQDLISSFRPSPQG